MTTTASAATATIGPDVAPDLGPVAEQGRIDSLDVLRGVAVLGILVMNVQSFGLPMATYENPGAFGDLTGANYWVWLVGYLLADLKFMSIFSMLFGAGVILFTSRIENRGRSAAALHYRRMGWLLGAGMVHGYFLWFGDILFMYALCGMILYSARHLAPVRLLLLGLASLLLTAALIADAGATYSHMQAALDQYDTQPHLAGEPEAEIIPGKTAEQVRALLAQARSSWEPPEYSIRHEIAAMTGDYGDELAFRAPVTVQMQSTVTAYFIWRPLGMMLLGMALFKWGVLSAARSKSFYAALTLAGFGVGVPIIFLAARWSFASDFELIHAKFTYAHLNYFASIPVALGWVGLVMLWCRLGVGRWLMAALGAVGRMALTNYLMHTIICTMVFYGRSGWGLAKFAQFDRTQLLGVVVAVFAFQLIASPIWLHFFRFGPFEWLWRTLTYWKLQPMRK